MLSSRESSQPRDQTQVSCISGEFFTAETPGEKLMCDWLHVKSTCQPLLVGDWRHIDKLAGFAIAPFFESHNDFLCSLSRAAYLVLALKS